jgi:Flp pilus assembly protein TadG
MATRSLLPNWKASEGGDREFHAGGSGTRRSARRYPGQATVELAFIVIMLTVLLAGTLELGRAFSAWIQVGNMARAGAQYGSVAAMLGDENLAGVEAAALQEQSTIYGVAPSVESEVVNDEYGFCAVRVTVDYDFSPILSFGVNPDSITLTRTTQMRLQFVSAQMEMPDEDNPCR